MTDDPDWDYQLLTLKARLGEIDGDDFETLFGDIAKAAWGSDYVKTIPMGSRGDLKCDGWRVSQGAAHQLYGPRYGRADVNAGLAKIDEDFRGAHGHWGAQLKRWVFVVGLYQGRVPSEFIRAVNAVSSELDVPAEIWTRDEIIALASGLAPEARRTLFGSAPSRADMVRDVTYANIGRALTALRLLDAAAPLDPVPLPPKMAFKAEFNGLSPAVRRFLALGQTTADNVRRYLMDKVDPGESQRMADAFRERYKAVVVAGAEPDAAFGKMLGFAGGGAADPGRDAAALAVVTHFFSTCEIFERPLADWPSA